MTDVTELVGTVFSGLSALVIEDVEDVGEVICVLARTRHGAVACTGCGAETARVHEYGERTAADVPVDGRPVLVKVRVRRMRRPALECKVQTFRKQVPGGLDRYQRRISRLTAQVSTVACELAGRASSRLLQALGIMVSRHTALRLLLKIPLPEVRVPRVLGIDDFALRRGLVYATVLRRARRPPRARHGPDLSARRRYARHHPPIPGMRSLKRLLALADQLRSASARSSSNSRSTRPRRPGGWCSTSSALSMSSSAS
jgi:hypothetical protein